ncbi:VacJ family lipoprotein [Alcaligenaceae bacterium]|nr:VacJ family lipoprotein [Alcaligenaceae bacterium]
MNNKVRPPNRRRIRLAAVAATAILASGCASVQQTSPRDPWESYNRGMFAFNDAVDGALLKPIAYAYRDLTPKPVRSCVSNIFGNLEDVWSAFNSFLQARGHDFFNTLGRVLFNSTMGLGGCIDVASMNGAYKIRNDLGTTLGVWGLGTGPYVVLPFWGASSLRDGTAMLGGLAADISVLTPVFEIDNVPVRNSILGLYAVEARESLLDADEIVNRTALDRYSFIRDAYLQQRDAMVNQRRSEGGVLPDYSDDDLPDYSDDEAANAATR